MGQRKKLITAYYDHLTNNDIRVVFQAMVARLKINANWIAGSVDRERNLENIDRPILVRG